MILKTYTRVFTTNLDDTLALILALHGVEPHLTFAYGEWTLVGIGDVLVVGGSEEALAPIRGSLGPWVVEDIDDVRATLVSAGAGIIREIMEVPTGRMMYARHPDGAVVEYVQWTDELVEKFVQEPRRRGVLSSQICIGLGSEQQHRRARSGCLNGLTSVRSGIMLDWVHLQSFLAISRHGSLSAAARALGMTQSTMGRRLGALHAAAGVRLLEKTPDGFLLTPAGKRVLASAERMEAEALSIELAVSGEDERIAGEVRITTVEAFGAYIITPMLRPLLAAHPDLRIELITDYRVLSLSRREADVAIRLAEFEQHEAVVKRVGGMTFGLFASRDYLEQRGSPFDEEARAGHSLVTCQQDLALMPEATRLLELVPDACVAVRANSRQVQLQAVRAGCGIGLVPWYMAQDQDELVELGAPHARVTRGLWLGVHRDARHASRIRLVIDHLTRGLQALAPTLTPASTTRAHASA